MNHIMAAVMTVAFLVISAGFMWRSERLDDPSFHYVMVFLFVLAAATFGILAVLPG